MSPEKINQLIAEHCGWTTDGKWWSHPTLPDNGGAEPYPPDYHTDLNAMHEAEETLHGITKEEYCCFLISENTENSSRWDCAHATASQRAEAFLKTIGKWKD